jgi:predicted nuclease of predicted toxin-antitoxin system
VPKPPSHSPRTRLLFDELLPWQVAEALRVLGHRASYVGNAKDRQPTRGSGDEDVLAHAKHTNQIIVTSNLDMILLCAEQGQDVVWIDPRGRQFTREKLALLFLEQVNEWERLLRETHEPVAIHALRTRVDALSLPRAASIAKRRLQVLRRRKRQGVRVTPGPLGPLLSDDF